MSGNANVSQIGNNKAYITIIDPNPPGSKIIPTEDLFIYVSLRITPKNRSVILSNKSGINLNSDDSVTINLIGTQTDENGNEYMSTNWTNIGGNIGGDLNGKKNKESFGIKNISISYGADMLPRVNITFLDIRGASMFDGFEHIDENGVKSNVSNYSSFFRTPYPLFELTVKGYYGKAVKYCLNLIKWNGNFREGNFEINAEFVGYNTSFLSDIIMDHVKAVTDTDDGFGELVNVYKKNSPGKDPITLTKFLRNIGDLDKYLADIKADNKNTRKNKGYDTLIQLNTALSTLSLIKAKVNDPIGVDNIDNPNYYSLEGNYIPFNGLVKRTNIFAIRDVQLITKDGVTRYYKEYRNDLIATIENFEKDLKQISDYSDFSILKKSGKQKVEELVPNSKNIFKPAKDLLVDINNLLIRDKGYVESSEAKPPYQFTGYTKDNGFLANTESEYFDYYPLRKIVTDLYDSLTNKRIELVKEVTKSINEQIDNKIISFNPSIGNVFEVLCNNIEAYLNVIYNVALNADSKNLNRVSILRGKNKDTSNENVYAWPMLYDENGEEMYLGKELTIVNNEQYFPEIRYIENLAAALVKEYRKTDTKNVTLENMKVMFPINPADIVFDPNYLAYNLTSFSSFQKQELCNTIINRAMVISGYSKFKNKISDFAKMEAAALYELTVDKNVRASISTFLNSEPSIITSEANNFTKSGSTFYSDTLDVNPYYEKITPYVSGSTNLFFDIDTPNSIGTLADKMINHPYDELYYNVKTALGVDNDIVLYFSPTNNENAEFNTQYYSLEENLTNLSWQESVLNGGNFPSSDKLINFVGKVKSDISQENYRLNNSVSYTTMSDDTISGLTTELGIDKDDLTYDDIKGMLILATYPFKSIDNILPKLKDSSKVVNIPLSYLAWIGAHMKRQYLTKKYNLTTDVLTYWCFIKNNEFNYYQIGQSNEYINISSLIKNIGKLPKPFDNFNLFNEKIEKKFIEAFEYWLSLAKSSGLIEFFNNPYDGDTFNEILNKPDYTNSNVTRLLISYTPNFWDVSTQEKFSIDENTLNDYIKVFAQKFNELNNPKFVKEVNPITPIKVTNNDIKLGIYRTTKNMYDKWIGGTINGKVHNSCGYDIDANKSILSYFRFIDKDYNDISEKAKIDLNGVASMLSNSRVSFLDLISRILRDNGYLFLPLPVYTDYGDINEIKSIFTPQTTIENAIGNASFIAMYNSGNSKFLDLGANYQYTNDGYDFVSQDNLPKNMVAPNNDKTKSVVAFRVAFGDENQSIFKNISINQEEFKDTFESLNATSELFDRRGATQRTFVGSNMYNVYSLRSYTLNFEMMGNPMIQPQMYLQLDNIPMFHGAYSVTNVSHEISPNTMTTKVKAIRKSKYSVPIITESTAYLPLDLEKNLKLTTNIDVAQASDFDIEYIQPNVISAYQSPISGTTTISSGLGIRRRNNQERMHYGIDIAVAVDTPVQSSWSGILHQKFNAGGYGLYTIIDHSNNTDKPFDDGYFYYTLYGHLNEITVDDLATLKSGQLFAKSGGAKGNPNSGSSTGPHLHYEIRRTKNKLKNINDYFRLTKLNEEVLDPRNFIQRKNSGVAFNSGGTPLHGELENIA